MAHGDEDSASGAPDEKAPVGAEDKQLAETADDSSSPSEDVVMVQGETPAGDGYRVIRSRENRLELAEIRHLRQGQAIQGEVVRLHPREQEERIFDVEVVLDAPKPKLGRPAQVATAAYREHYDATFGCQHQWNSGNSGNSSELN